jgi:NTE family protein
LLTRGEVGSVGSEVGSWTHGFHAVAPGRRTQSVSSQAGGSPDSLRCVNESRRVALALGSGGARGYAHIGVIQVLEERGFEIAGVAGSSMGAVIGAVWAAGKLAEYEDWVRGLSRADVLRMLDVSLRAPGAMRAEKVLAHVRDLIGNVLIENLPVPFTAVATDLISRREVWLQRGPVDLAIRASIAIPGVFTPVMLNGRLLADGGLMDPIPVSPMAALDADLTIAVSAGGEREDPPATAAVSETAEPRPLDEWIARFRRGAARALDSEVVRSVVSHHRPEEPSEPQERIGAEPAALPEGLTGLDVMNYSLAAMQTLVTRYRLAGSPPDVLVTVPVTDVRAMDFHLADTMISLGRTATERALGEADPGAGTA